MNSCLTLPREKRLKFGNTKLISPELPCIHSDNALNYKHKHPAGNKSVPYGEYHIPYMGQKIFDQSWWISRRFFCLM